MDTTSHQVPSETRFTYDEKTDRFVGTDGNVYTCEEVDLLDEMETKWRDSQPHYSFYQWVDIFSEEKKSIISALRIDIQHREQRIRAIEADHEYTVGVLQNAYRENPSPETFRKTKETIASLRNDANLRILPIKNELAILQSRVNYLIGKKVAQHKISPDEIERARAVPINTLVNVGRDNKAICPFHEDTKPSLHVYRDNHAYCFVCQKRASAIDIYMALHSCDFKAAVKALSV